MLENARGLKSHLSLALHNTHGSVWYIPGTVFEDHQDSCAIITSRSCDGNMQLCDVVMTIVEQFPQEYLHTEGQAITEKHVSHTVTNIHEMHVFLDI